MPPLIALLTDFGTTDHYVGVMKGVMKRLCPAADFIDITHNIPPQDVRAAAFTLMANNYYFPHGTVFLVVVDPGVGTQRKPVAVTTEHYAFVAPDNGVLSYVLMQTPAQAAVELLPHAPDDVSHTFHGRDIFAPAAAKIGSGTPLHEVGTLIHEPLQSYPQPTLATQEEDIIGEVLYIDHFGNIITSIGTCHWRTNDTITLRPQFTNDKAEITLPAATQVTIGNETLQHVHRTYGDVPRGELLALVGSSAFIEVAINQGNAAQRLGVSVGDPIKLNITQG